jgi:hypothetical protein
VTESLKHHKLDNIDLNQQAIANLDNALNLYGIEILTQQEGA